MPEVFENYILAFAIAFLLLGFFIILLSVLYSRKQVKNRKEKALAETQFRQALLQTQLEIREQTLQYISRELHDNLGQIASLIKINLNTINVSNTEKAIQKIESTKELTIQLITDLKLLSVSLGIDRISQGGLANAIGSEMERLQKTGQYVVEFIQEGEAPEIDIDKSIVLYRMLQESINNIIKHSDATHISVKLNNIEKLLTLAISDNGKGFDLKEKEKNGGGAGLTNLKHRALLINATLTIHSALGSGTSLTITLPT